VGRVDLISRMSATPADTTKREPDNDGAVKQPEIACHHPEGVAPGARRQDRRMVKVPAGHYDYSLIQAVRLNPLGRDFASSGCGASNVCLVYPEVVAVVPSSVRDPGSVAKNSTRIRFTRSGRSSMSIWLALGTIQSCASGMDEQIRIV
jgi:hypothetical protein